MPLFALDYSRGADLPVDMRKEVTVHAWQVADANAYPALTIFNEQFSVLPPTPAQLHQAEAISLALADFAQARLAARAAGETPPRSSVDTVATHAGPIEVKLTLASAPPRVPHEHRPSAVSARPRAKWSKKKRK
jgi:tartrate dehydratase beta subunit/fumarate hydratase class I family protein